MLQTNRPESAHSHGVIAALLFGFEKAHGKEPPGLHTQHQDDASNEAGHVELGLGELRGRVGRPPGAWRGWDKTAFSRSEL